MKHRRTAIAVSTLAACGALAWTAQVTAGGEKVAFPDGYDKGVLYATVDRHDIKQYRELYTSKESLDAVRRGQPIPGGTVLTLVQYKARADAQGNPVRGADGKFQKGDLLAYTVMEKRQGWGAEYADDIRNGEWEYRSFSPDGKVNEKADLKPCFTCHLKMKDQDYVFSIPQMKTASK